MKKYLFVLPVAALVLLAGCASNEKAPSAETTKAPETTAADETETPFTIGEDSSERIELPAIPLT